MRRSWFLLALLIVPVALIAGCSDDSDSGSEPDADITEDETDDGLDDAEAEARAAAVEFFEAQSSLDIEAALDRSTGPAALAVQWAKQVDEVEQVRGTPYEVVAAPSNTTTVSIDSVSRNDDGTWSATGYVQMSERPSVLAPGPLPTSHPRVRIQGWFATDLLFAETDGRFLVRDYRMDDSPYPVSQLFMKYEDLRAVAVRDDRAAPDDGATTTTVDPGDDVVVRLGHRDIDGTVQYTLGLGLDGVGPSSAQFIPLAADAPLPAPDATGEAVELLLDRPADASEEPDPDGDGGEVEPALAVRQDAMPGGPGVLRVTFVDPTDAELVVDVRIPDFGPLEAKPTNTIRALVAPTTTSTSTTTSTTTTTTTTSSTTTTQPTTTTTRPTTTTTQPTTTTTRPTTTTTSSP